MAIDAIPPAFREIAPASAVSQVSLTHGDREREIEEGRPPMEVASTEQDALYWQNVRDPRDKRLLRRKPKKSEDENLAEDSEETPEGSVEEPPQEVFADQVDLEDSSAVDEGEDSSEKKSTGTLFDSLS